MMPKQSPCRGGREGDASWCRSNHGIAVGHSRTWSWQPSSGQPPVLGTVQKVRESLSLYRALAARGGWLWCALLTP